MGSPPIISGHTAFGSVALNLVEAARRQVEEVAAFRAQVRDFSAPRMERVSSIPAPPLAERGQHFDATA